VNLMRPARGKTFGRQNHLGVDPSPDHGRLNNLRHNNGEALGRSWKSAENLQSQMLRFLALLGGSRFPILGVLLYPIAVF
jgi:hypothetical protein